jgi:excisionase family DNA binding protein
MSEQENGQSNGKQGNAPQGELLTLTEVSNRTGISMPTLQRYKKEFQDRIPSVGQGRTQRYPEESLPVFEEIKKENIKKRGRPRKSGKPAASKPRKKSAPQADRSGLLTLTEVSERTGISYPTLVRYMKLHADRIPHEGKGRKRRYHPEAVEAFQEIRSQSGRGRRKKAAGGGKAAAGGGGAAGDGSLARRVRSLEKSQERLEKQIRSLIEELKKPLTVTVKRSR